MQRCKKTNLTGSQKGRQHRDRAAFIVLFNRPYSCTLGILSSIPGIDGEAVLTRFESDVLCLIPYRLVLFRIRVFIPPVFRNARIHPDKND